MREILFRGKCKIDGGWVYGCIFRNKEKTELLIRTDTDDYPIKLDSLGQYTGLKDKNGTKVFEGDIVKRQWGDYPYQYQLYVVKFSFGKFGFEAINTKGTRYIPYHYECEVIGNIHDNKLEDFENGC